MTEQDLKTIKRERVRESQNAPHRWKSYRRSFRAGACHQAEGSGSGSRDRNGVDDREAVVKKRTGAMKRIEEERRGSGG